MTDRGYRPFILSLYILATAGGTARLIEANVNNNAWFEQASWLFGIWFFLGTALEELKR